MFKMSEKRQKIPLKEKQKYVTLIKEGTNLDGINYQYRKKYGTDFARSSFYKWKAESKFRENKKKTQTTKDFEKKITIEYQKMKTKLKARGMSSIIKSVRDQFLRS